MYIVQVENKHLFPPGFWKGFFPPGEEVLPSVGYMGMCRWKGLGFQAIYSGIGSSNHRKLV